MNMIKKGIFDTHCHLNYFQKDLDLVIKNAIESGITCMITVNTKLEEAKTIQEISKKYTEIFSTVGIHPLNAQKSNNLYEKIKLLCKAPKVVAIGEVGLDYYYSHDTKNLQKENFDIHIGVSNELNLPLIIHSRDAENDTIEFLKKSKYPGILHCFTGTYEMAKKALDLGFYISFSGILTYTSANDLREVAKKIPIDRILIETDAPYLVPKNFRKNYKRNEPALITETLKKISEIKIIQQNEMIELLFENSLKIFKLLEKNLHKSL